MTYFKEINSDHLKIIYYAFSCKFIFILISIESKIGINKHVF